MRGRPRDGDRYCGVERFVPIELKRHLPGGDRANLPDAQAVKSLRALVRMPQVHQALERGNDTALCFVLRAVNRILSDEDQPNTTINRLWDVLDQTELNSALRQNSRMILGQKKPPAR